MTKRSLLTHTGVFAAGIIVTLGAGALLSRQQSQQILDLVGVQKTQNAESPSVQKLDVGPEQQHRLELSQSFNAVIQDIQPKQGWDLDQYAFNDLISINQNTLGLLRKITTDASDPQLKSLAQQLQAQRQQEVEALNKLQSATGHSKHLH